jgi:hypothetical protein
MSFDGKIPLVRHLFYQMDRGDSSELDSHEISPKKQNLSFELTK